MKRQYLRTLKTRLHEMGHPGPIRGFWDRVVLALLFRYLAHSTMLLLNILGEGDSAPTLHDRIIAAVPLVPFIARYNYHLWVICYLPLALYLWYINRNRFVEFLYAGGVMSLLRGLTIFVTQLGPVNGRDINAGRPMSELISGWIHLVNPLEILTTNVAQIYLTKDLFFSGHTASTFLVVLYAWPYKRFRLVAVVAHLFILGVVFFSHLHYTIDVVGGWLAAFSIYSGANRLFGTQAGPQSNHH